MVRKGQKGQSKAERDEATKKLDIKVQQFIAEIKAKKIENPDRSVMLRYFTPADLSALWKRLQKARGRAPTNVQEAWDNLKSLGKQDAGKEQEKTLVTFLDDYLKDDGSQNWIDHLVTITDEAEKKRTVSKKKQRFYRGELWRIHGRSEAERFIKSGKFKEDVDSDGDECFIKVTKSEVQSKSRVQRQSVQR